MSRHACIKSAHTLPLFLRSVAISSKHRTHQAITRCGRRKGSAAAHQTVGPVAHNRQEPSARHLARAVDIVPAQPALLLVYLCFAGAPRLHCKSLAANLRSGELQLQCTLYRQCSASASALPTHNNGHKHRGSVNRASRTRLGCTRVARDLVNWSNAMQGVTGCTVQQRLGPYRPQSAAATAKRQQRLRPPPRSWPTSCPFLACPRQHPRSWQGRQAALTSSWCRPAPPSPCLLPLARLGAQQVAPLLH
jgi:hypothetical protein